MFGEFLIEVGILKSRILPVNRLPHFTRQFTPLGREGRIPCRAARLSHNFLIAYEGLSQLASRSPAYSSCLSKASVRLFLELTEVNWSP